MFRSLLHATQLTSFPLEILLAHANVDWQTVAVFNQTLLPGASLALFDVVTSARVVFGFRHVVLATLVLPREQNYGPLAQSALARSKQF